MLWRPREREGENFSPGNCLCQRSTQIITAWEISTSLSDTSNGLNRLNFSMQSYSSTYSLAISRNQYPSLATDILYLRDTLSSIYRLSGIWSDKNKETGGLKKNSFIYKSCQKRFFSRKGSAVLGLGCRRTCAVCPHPLPPCSGRSLCERHLALRRKQYRKKKGRKE